MKKAVIYGAGNIGRGFIGHLLSQSNYALCFVDVDQALCDELNRRGAYPVRVLHGGHEDIVRYVRAVSGRDTGAISEAVAQADLMATAVGVGALPHIAVPLAAGITQRFESGAGPLDILLCENKLDAGAYLRALVYAALSPRAKAWAEQSIGFVEASVGRMVPVQTDEMRGGDPLRICVEAYAELPVDKAAFRGELPAIAGLLPAQPFAFYMERKLYVHNMGHAVAAYLGFQRGYTYIWEAMGDPSIKNAVHGAMRESAAALCKKYGCAPSLLQAYILDLLPRFANKRLEDTIARVGRDLPRKLADSDRLFGAARLCEEQGVGNANILKGIGAALLFDDDGKRLTLRTLRRMADAVAEEMKGYDAQVS